jgi:hypothetical protein
MNVLETPRLRLRWFGESDAAFILALVNDPSWMTNIGDRGVRTVEEARAWIAGNIRSVIAGLSRPSLPDGRLRVPG